jgi:hypothetical protein
MENSRWENEWEDKPEDEPKRTLVVTTATAPKHPVGMVIQYGANRTTAAPVWKFLFAHR